MSENRYEVVDVYWRVAKTTIQIVRFPEADIEDKLALVSDEDGISKSAYDDFLISKCLIDVDRIGRHITNISKDAADETNLIEELVKHIIETNPLLNPELLVISKTGVIKIASDKESSVQRLVDNPRWNEKPEDVIDDVLNDIAGSTSCINDLFDSPTDGTSDKDIVLKLWEEVSLTLKIKKYDESDMENLFKNHLSFSGPTNYKMFVIIKCLANYAQLMVIIDSMGITQDIAPDQVADNLYNFCIEVNPFLSIDEIDKDVITIGTNHRGIKTPPDNTPRRSRSVDRAVPAKPCSSTSKDKKEKRVFSSVKKEDLLSLSERMRESIIGQDVAVETVVEAIQVAGAGLRDPVKPIGVFMFTGETGVGKTFCAKVLAKELVGDNSKIVRIDCSEYSQPHEYSKLIGSPPGYVSSDQGGFLTNKIMEEPFSVVLFDEVEKAHSKFFDVLLQLFDEGRLTSGKGEVVDFSDCVVILTSNVGAGDVRSIEKRVGFGGASQITQDKRVSAITAALKRQFKPEFLNRIDSVVTFNALGEEECYKIIDLEFKEVERYLEAKNITLETTEVLRKHIFDIGFSREYGARPLKRAIEREVIKPLSIDILKDKIKENNHVTIDVKDGKIVFSAKKKKASIIKVSKEEL